MSWVMETLAWPSWSAIWRAVWQLPRPHQRPPLPPHRPVAVGNTARRDLGPSLRALTDLQGEPDLTFDFSLRPADRWQAVGLGPADKETLKSIVSGGRTATEVGTNRGQLRVLPAAARPT
jgi:hypothetical protein